jgi:hypothetical protein
MCTYSQEGQSADSFVSKFVYFTWKYTSVLYPTKLASLPNSVNNLDPKYIKNI